VERKQEKQRGQHSSPVCYGAVYLFSSMRLLVSQSVRSNSSLSMETINYVSTERERETDRQTDKEGGRGRERERDRQTDIL
jgi:hypothetical protein